jgi:small subunit ribosomal protein S18
MCRDKVEWVDYKDVNALRKYMSDRGKIRSRRVTGNCAQHQRAIAEAIKTARELVLLPYTQRTVTERPGGRGGRGDRGDRGSREPRGERGSADDGATLADVLVADVSKPVTEELAPVAADSDGDA